MRFVDTPGIIANTSTGKDNREEIKTILRSEMENPNAKLCVLLEATEFAKNPIIEILDTSFVRRDKWINNAIFLMTKFDKQLEDSRTGSKANKFFQEFQNNQCIPHLVITPTLPKEDLECERLFADRNQLLEKADKHEKMKFDLWLEGHEQFRESDPQDGELNLSSIG